MKANEESERCAHVCALCEEDKPILGAFCSFSLPLNHHCYEQDAKPKSPRGGKKNQRKARVTQCTPYSS